MCYSYAATLGLSSSGSLVEDSLEAAYDPDSQVPYLQSPVVFQHWQQRVLVGL
jgi:hypothetical protein